VLTTRTGGKFHDGTDFDAEAVRYNLERIRNPDTGSIRGGEISVLDTVEVLDASTVKLRLKQPFAAFLFPLVDVADCVASPTALERWGKEYGLHPAGTGPFKAVEYLKDAHSVLERNGDYRPLYVQYLIWLGNVLTGDLGWSYLNNQAVWDIIRPRILPTVQIPRPSSRFRGSGACWSIPSSPRTRGRMAEVRRRPARASERLFGDCTFGLGERGVELAFEVFQLMRIQSPSRCAQRRERHLSGVCIIVTRCEEDAHTPIGPKIPSFMGRASRFARDLCIIRVDLKPVPAVTHQMISSWSKRWCH